MDQDTYKKYRMVIVAVISLVTALSINFNVWWISFLAVVAGFSIMIYLRRNLDEVLYDERIIQIRTKASAMTLSVSVVGLVLIGVFLFYLSKTGYPQYENLAYSCFYISNAILLLNAVFGWYYGIKYGG